MMYIRAIRTAPLVGCVAVARHVPGAGPGAANAAGQRRGDRVAARERRPSRVRDFFRSIKQRIAKVTGQVLPLTKCEKWSVPKANLEAVKKEAAKRGVVVTELGADWNHIMRSAPADTKLNEKQSGHDRAGQGRPRRLRASS